jgi:hypothetical protein
MCIRQTSGQKATRIHKQLVSLVQRVRFHRVIDRLLTILCTVFGISFGGSHGLNQV